MKVKIKTLGCKVNYVESLALEEMLLQAGFDVVEEEDCDIFILNSCSVTNESDKKSRQALSRNRKINPENYAVIMGCYSQVSKNELLENQNVNLVSGNRDKLEIVELLQQQRELLEKDRVKDISRYRVFEQLPFHGLGSKTRGFIKIQDGCDNYCTYCIIPHARGRVRSRELDFIEEEARHLYEQGTQEIVVTGIEVASYGKDLDQVQLIDAIEATAKGAPGIRIRMSSLEIGCITEDFLQRVKNIPGFCHHFHLSLQSGCDKILKKMGRKYTTDIFAKKVELIRKYFPYAGLTSDVIVGFPYETEEDFDTTCQYVQAIGLLRIHVFPYSPRKNTPAARMPQIDGTIKTERAKKLRDISEQLERDFQRNILGKPQEVLIEERRNGIFYGYTSNYVRVELSTNENKDLKLNQVYTVLPKAKGDDIQWTVFSAKS
ncbi:MAG: tRNA (N(6)-L-threonylcarbamoyladenosine(37)-C(2))-methylthiotransferase MtaB [Tissierellia bacterium]|nr:tRNA (N(6)-L-threonylcarbamoyladenosine(37)-C(2))-methylthiotransferase MtaB [Tissierellia bacterium]